MFWDAPNITVPADFPIKVDEPALVAAVKGGVSTRVLLDYLANYRRAPQSSRRCCVSASCCPGLNQVSSLQ